MTILIELSNARIFSTELSDDKTTLEFTEECDTYFHLKLTKQRVIELANELMEIANTMPDEPVPFEERRHPSDDDNDMADTRNWASH